MPKIDIDNYIEQSGMRKARFGGYEPEDVHQAMEDLCADYEQHLTAMTSAHAPAGERRPAPPRPGTGHAEPDPLDPERHAGRAGG